MGRYRVTVDTGGTFSDFVYLDEATHEISVAKLPSTPDDPARAILEGIAAMGAHPDLLVHGSTVATNAVIERRGARTALVTTEGMRDLLVIEKPYAQSLSG